MCVKVEVVECPDLVAFGCAAPGLGGKPKLVEGGGEPFNHDTDYNKEVHFKLERMAGLAGHGPGSYLQVTTHLSSSSFLSSLESSLSLS